MNILDEDRELITEETPSDPVLYWINDDRRTVGPASLLSWPCIRCQTCIGRKYNRLHNGCPICGAHMHMHDTLCTRCGCIMMGCGGGDIRAVVIPMLKVNEDTI